MARSQYDNHHIKQRCKKKMTAKKYNHYLKGRRWTGLIYRYLYIYPFFIKYLGKRNIDYGCGIGDFLHQYMKQYCCYTVYKRG